MLVEEGIRASSGGLHGDLRWSENTIAGTPVYSHPSPSADTEIGLLRVQTGVNSGDGGMLAFPAVGDRSFFRYPPPGSVWCVKIRNVTDGLQRYAFAGFVEVTTAAPAGGATNGFIGVVCEATTGTANWIGRVRVGTTVTDVDLGVAADTTFRILGFEHVRTEMSGVSEGVQFFVLDASLGNRVFRTNIGTPISTNLPTTTLTPACVGIASRAAGARIVEVDFWNLGGQIAR